MAGIVLIRFNGSFVLQLNPLGDVLAALAAVTWAVYSNFMRKISYLGYNTIACTRRAFLYGLIFMAPALYFLPFGPDYALLLQKVKLCHLLFLGLGASALCFVTWNWAVGILGAVKTSFYIYIVPVVTIISAAIILHETITMLAYGGALLTLAGLLISERKAFIREGKGAFLMKIKKPCIFKLQGFSLPERHDQFRKTGYFNNSFTASANSIMRSFISSSVWSTAP
jgi:drug/metabolite transporter (DMT)-like permease